MASSDSRGRRSGGKGIGSTDQPGICRRYIPDGRYVSLLNILLTNYCIYDCSFCITRQSSGVRRPGFTPNELVQLTIEFYRRNYPALHRRGVSQLGNHSRARLHDGAARRRRASDQDILIPGSSLYDPEQLLAWVPRVGETGFNVARVHITFNNNYANYARTNAAEMAQLVEVQNRER